MKKNVIKLFNIVIVFFFVEVTSAKDIEHFLMPMDKELAQNSILESIENSKRSIDLAMFMFTNKKIANSLIKKSSSFDDNSVRVVVDKKINPNGSKINSLKKYKNIKVFLSNGLPITSTIVGKMHAKLLIIDDETVYLGSANFTESAFNSNFEILVKIKDKTTAKLYKLFFNRILATAELIDES